MIVVTQVVDRADVGILGKSDTKIEIQKGIIAYLGVAKSDTEDDVYRLVRKIIKLRVFPDNKDKMNLDIQTVRGEVLLISQFTLLADLKDNNRPNFIAAAGREQATILYDLFADKLKSEGVDVKTGYFGEHMMITNTQNGPVTIILDSNKL